MSRILSNIELGFPWALLLLLPLIFYWVWDFKGKVFHPEGMKMSSLIPKDNSNRVLQLLALLPKVLKALAISLFVVALARPQLALKEEKVTAEGIDIMLALDVSSSMLTQDFKPNRLEVSKYVADEFVKKREHDRVGLVLFSGESYTQCPLTTDHRVVSDFLQSVEVGALEDGTAIGMGLATAVNRMKNSTTKSKIVILLTDGVNNQGYIDPSTASEIATQMDVRVYTIGVGTDGYAYGPVGKRNGKYVFDRTRGQIDEGLLKQIAKDTGGKYYRAIDEQSLLNIYAEIDVLEKTKIEVSVYKRYEELFRKFGLFGLISLLLSYLINLFILKTTPHV